MTMIHASENRLLKNQQYKEAPALVAQWIAHRTSNPVVVGSSPTEGAFVSQGQ